MKKIAIVLLILISLQGCATVGTRIDLQQQYCSSGKNCNRYNRTTCANLSLDFGNGNSIYIPSIC